MTIKGSVDQLTTRGATGWIYAASEHRPLVVEAVLHHRVIGEALADAYRHDLAEVGLGDGRCGFSIEFGLPIEAAYLPFVNVRPAGGDVELPRFSLSGFQDFLGRVYNELPMTGRHKSIFGGLWTDRTDALALLRGRRDLGRFGDDVAYHLERLIVHGHVVLDVPSSQHPEMDAPDLDDLERAIATMFFRPLVQDTLSAMFDDTPVVVRGAVHRDMQRDFRQPCSGQTLSSPVECVALIASAPTHGGASPTSIELVQGSHDFPDFTSHAEPRWTLPPGAAALAHAASVGAPIQVLTLRPHQIALIAAGTIYRILHPSADGTSEALCLPRRRLPLRQEAARPYRRARDFAGKIALLDAA